MENNANQKSETIVVEGTVDSISSVPDQESGIYIARVLLRDDHGNLRNVQVSAANVEITRTNEIETDEDSPDEPPIRVRLEAKSSIWGGLVIEVACFIISKDEHADWVREAFGFRRPGEDFGVSDVPEDYMYGRC